MTTTPKTEATRLAEFKDLEYWPAGVGLTDWVESACAELLRLDAALADELNNRDVLDKMLTQCITERDQLRAQVERLQGGEPVTLTDEVPAHVAGLIEHRRELDAIEFFESANRDSHGFRRSVRGTYVNPAVARDWKWFQLGMQHATKE